MPTDAPLTDQSLRSIAELLRRRAAERPDQRAFVFLPDPGERGAGEIVWTYADLDRRASGVAASLAGVAEPGDRAVLVFPPGLDFLAAFFGCLYAGVLPVPATYPKPRRPLPRLDAIVADCTPRVALTTTETLGILQLDNQAPAVRQIEWIAVDRCEDAPFKLVERNPADAAFLQYTSGSTSQPRGVIVTHGNLLHNLELIRDGFGLESAASGGAVPTAVFWLPAYHDMGLIGGILTPLFIGGTSYLSAPATFLQRPIAWLETIARTGATISGAPNFAYELCTRKTTPEQRARLNLSRWSSAFCGAEPIDAGTLNDFAAAFAPAGFRSKAFYPCYGLAEATLMVTGGKGPSDLRVFHADSARLAENVLTDSADPANVRTLVSCGRPLGEQVVRVVDSQTFAVCEDGVVGEIWIRGGSVAAGYWNHPEELWQTFGGRLADGSGPYLRTGDLGAFKDGELFVTGRAKDLIIIRGRNLYPQDVERTAQQADEAVDQGAAFSVTKDGHEELVVVHQVHREFRRDDMAPVIRAIRSAVVEEHEVDPYAIVLLRPGALPLTSSGKVQRAHCRELFEAGSLDELARAVYAGECGGGDIRSKGATHSCPQRPKFLDQIESYSPEALAGEIQQWMVAWLAERVEASAAELTPTAAFTELGMDSLTSLELNVEFEKVLGIRLPPTAAWSYPTPATLSQYLAESLLGIAPTDGPEGLGPIDSWFQAMEADAQRP
jgi:acyl-CoA synthetase (AMP-forming)/AMP-acid ligase II/acyl carrier protein